jgi:hypothetical protein
VPKQQTTKHTDPRPRPSGQRNDATGEHTAGYRLVPDAFGLATHETYGHWSDEMGDRAANLRAAWANGDAS